MRIYNDISRLPQFEKAVITIGTFDGVHHGHLQIIRQLIEEAKAVNGTPVVITFYPHPKKITGKNDVAVSILNTTYEKSILLANAGIEHLVVVPFTEEFAKQSAENYITEFLVKSFHPHTIIVGYDHRFGNNREGDYRLLEKNALESGFTVKEIPRQVLDEITVSSTAIRRHLIEGNIIKANKLLGYPYFFSGEVVHGNMIGREIGFPTANIIKEDHDKLIPGDGVYAVKVSIQEKKENYKGMMNIGLRPTVDGKIRVTEVNIFDFDEDIYNKKIRIECIQKIRDEEKFAGLEELKQQLKKDKISAMEMLQ